MVTGYIIIQNQYRYCDALCHRAVARYTRSSIVASALHVCKISLKCFVALHVTRVCDKHSKFCTVCNARAQSKCNFDTF